MSSYLKPDELKLLSDEDLDLYARVMTKDQLDIIEAMDKWLQGFNNAANEYKRRKGSSRSIFINSDSDVKH